MISFFRKLSWLSSRSQKEIELREELQFHLDEEAEELRAQGTAIKEASQAAFRELGNITIVQENTRDVWGWTPVEQLLQDIRFAARTLAKERGFTFTVIATLALVIGVNATVFAITDAVLFKGLPYVSSDRMLYLRTYDTRHPNDSPGVSIPDFEDWRTLAKSFQQMGACRDLVQISLRDQSGPPESYFSVQVTSNTFSVIGQRPIIGRDFALSDEEPGSPSVAILTYDLWERRYAKDPAIVGHTIRINGTLVTVIGVMARSLSFPNQQHLWMPLKPTPASQKRDSRARSSDGLMFVFGRMAEGVTVTTANAEMKSIGLRLANAYPLTNQGFVPVARTFREYFHARVNTIGYGATWGAAAIVLLIACANLANLQLVRAISRSREISVRIALGAGRWRVIRQLIIESLLLSIAGSVPGWWIAKTGLRAYTFASWPYVGRDPWSDYAMDGRALVYLVAITAGAGLLFGLAPALRLLKIDVNAKLKEGGPGSAGGVHRARLSGFLVTGQMALALMLLAGAGVMVRSFLNLYHPNVGIQTANIVTMTLPLVDFRYPGTQEQISFYDSLQKRLASIPGVESVAIANRIPVRGRPSGLPYEVDSAGLKVVGGKRPSVLALIVGPAYFRTLGTSVLSGREFNEADRTSAAPVIVVNQRFASQHWPGENPLGKRLRLVDEKTPEVWRTVIGIAPNIVQRYPDPHPKEIEALVYVPYLQQAAANMTVIARTRVSSASLANSFRREIQAMDPDQCIWDFAYLSASLARWDWANALDAVLLLILAGIALLLATIGLYAVIAHSVTQRTREIAIRVATGGTVRDILSLVFREGTRQLGLGLVIGLLGSLGVNRILKSELVGISPDDPATLAVVSVALILAAALGCLIPAQRAVRVNPVSALRHE